MAATRDTTVVEMHCHTEFSSDGMITFDGMVRTAGRRGIDVVCVTDHDTIDGALEFRRRARLTNASLQIVVGEERTLADGSHLIGLFLHDPITSSDLAAAVEEVHAQGGAVLVPHPFRRKDGLFRGVPDPGAADVRGIDAFEIFNAKGSYADNARARDLTGLPLGVFGGSDAHYESDIGQCVCEMKRDGSPEDALRAMLKGRTPFRVRGIHKAPGSAERRYAPVYYRIRPFVRLPKRLLPVAKQAYRYYRNHLLQPTPPVLEEVYRHE